MSRVVDNPEGYFRSRLFRRDPLLVRLEEEAAAEGIPIIGPVAGRFIQMLAAVSGARRILELGCATGYSAIHLARGSAAAHGRVFTVERDAARADRASGNFAEAGLSERVTILRGDALEITESLEGPFDMIFLDIEKSAYLELLPRCTTLLSDGKILAADNTAFADAGPFLDALERDPFWETLNLYSFLPGHAPEWDGMTIALRRDRQR